MSISDSHSVAEIYSLKFCILNIFNQWNAFRSWDLTAGEVYLINFYLFNYWDIYTIILVFGHFRPGSRFPQLRCIYFNFSFWTFSISDFQSPAETHLPNFTHFQLVIHNRAFMISLKLYFSFNIVNMWVEFCGWGICNKPNELLNIFN